MQCFAWVNLQAQWVTVNASSTEAHFRQVKLTETTEDPDVSLLPPMQISSGVIRWMQPSTPLRITTAVYVETMQAHFGSVHEAVGEIGFTRSSNDSVQTSLTLYRSLWLFLLGSFYCRLFEWEELNPILKPASSQLGLIVETDRFLLKEQTFLR